MNPIVTDIFWTLTFGTFFFMMMRNRSGRRCQVQKQGSDGFKPIRQEFSVLDRGKHTEL